MGDVGMDIQAVAVGLASPVYRDAKKVLENTSLATCGSNVVPEMRFCIVCKKRVRLTRG